MLSSRADPSTAALDLLGSAPPVRRRSFSSGLLGALTVIKHSLDRASVPEACFSIICIGTTWRNCCINSGAFTEAFLIGSRCRPGSTPIDVTMLAECFPPMNRSAGEELREACSSADGALHREHLHRVRDRRAGGEDNAASLFARVWMCWTPEEEVEGARSGCSLRQAGDASSS